MLTKKTNNNDFIPGIILLMTIIFLELVFFRSMIFNPDNLVGDLGDSRLISLTLEHWYKVFNGKEAIRDLSMFYPVKNTLGYSDALFLLSIPYSFFRTFGFTWLQSYQLTIVGTHFFGGICLAFLLRKYFKLSLFACVIGLIIGNYSNSYFMIINHPQFVAYSLVPLLFVFLLEFIFSIKQNLQKRRIIFGMLSIFLFIGLLLTSYYVAFFTGIFLLFSLIFISILSYKKKLIARKQLLNCVKANKFEIISYFAMGLLLLIPFFWIYMPILKEMGSRSWGEVLSYLPYWYNFFNVSSSNLLWSFPSDYRGIEQFYGFPLITVILLIFGCSYFIKKAFSNDIKLPSNAINYYITIGFSFAIIVISFLLLKIDINIDGNINTISPWFIVYILIPGASPIRTVSRFIQFLSLPSGILIAYFVSEKYYFFIKKYPNYILYFVFSIFVLSSFIFLEHHNSREISHWSKSGMNDYLDKVSSPPDDCESFLLINNSRETFYVYHLDAWSIANKYDIKTVNGYSGMEPKNWEYFFNMGVNKNYSDLRHWVERYNLQNLYLYDYNNDIWINYSNEVILTFRQDISAFAQTQNGIFTNNGLTSNGEQGFLMFGPYITIEKGSYIFTIDMELTQGANRDDIGNIDIATSLGTDTLYNFAITVLDFIDGKAQIAVPFKTDETIERFELRVFVNEGIILTITDVLVEIISEDNQ